FIISHAAPDARAIRSSTCGSSGKLFLRVSSTSVRVRLEIQLPTALVGYVGIELRRGEIGVPEHFLNRSQVCSSLEKVCGKRMAEQVRMDPARVEARFRGQPAEDQEGARARERGCVHAAASLSRSASPGERLYGNGLARRGKWTPAAGLSSRAPSNCWWR